MKKPGPRHPEGVFTPPLPGTFARHLCPAPRVRGKSLRAAKCSGHKIQEKGFPDHLVLPVVATASASVPDYR